MKANADKCHLLVAKHENVSVKLESETITGDISVELLGLDINGNLNFNEHVRKLCAKGNQKFHALARISKYLSKNNLHQNTDENIYRISVQLLPSNLDVSLQIC